MQDRCAGDLDDFLKLGVLRWLVAPTVDAVAHRSVVLVDADDGLRRSDHSTASQRSKSEKHAYLDELRAFVERGQSIVAYHHADRSATVPVQAERRMADAADELGVEPLAAVRAARGTTRLFLVVPSPAHRQHQRARLHDLERSHWADELVVYWRARRQS